MTSETLTLLSILNNWTLALIVFGLLQLADVITTMSFLERGVGEANPIIRFCMEHLGQYGWIIVKLLIATGIAWGLHTHAQNMPWSLWLISAGYVGLVIWNIRAGR